MFRSMLAVILAGSLCTLGCEDKSTPPKPAAKPGAAAKPSAAKPAPATPPAGGAPTGLPDLKAAQEKVAGAAEAAAAKAKEARDSLVSTTQTKVDEWTASASQWRAKADLLTGEAKTTYEGVVSGLDSHIKAVKDKLAELKNASSETIDTVSAELNSAVGTATKAFTDAKSKLGL